MKEEFELDIPLNKIDVIFGRYYKYNNIFNIIICIVKRHIYIYIEEGVEKNYPPLLESNVKYFIITNVKNLFTRKIVN